MKLIPDWKQVLQKAWSMRLILLAITLEAIERALPYFNIDLGVPGLLSAISLVVTAAAAGARLLVQNGVTHAKPDPDQVAE